MRSILFSLLLVASGCAAAPAPRTVVGPPRATTESTEGGVAGQQANEQASAAPAAPTSPPGTIPRSQLVTTIDGGLGRFLGTVRVAAVLERGGFVGFRIVSFRDPSGIYAGVDLVPGDVVLRVNGSPIERPEQALSVWNGLRVTSELYVEYVRNGERREIRFPIVD